MSFAEHHTIHMFKVQDWENDSQPQWVNTKCSRLAKKHDLLYQHKDFDRDIPLCQVLAESSRVARAIANDLATTLAGVSWILDIGSGLHLAGISEPEQVVSSAEPLTLITANGHIISDTQVASSLPLKDAARLLPDSPHVFSLGRLCLNDDFDFAWSRRKAPKLTLPSGYSIDVPVENFVPIINEELIETITLLLSQPPGNQHIHLASDGTIAATVLDQAAPVPAPAPIAPIAQDRPDQKVLDDATDPNSTRHLATHFPSLPNCKFCQQAKQKQA